MFTRRPPYAAAIISERNGDRRTMCRYSAAKGFVQLGWWDGPDFQTTNIALKDISLSGASALTGTPPPPATPIWLGLDKPSFPDWIEAAVVEVIPHRWRPSLVRMKFSESCPYEFFKAATHGLDPTADPTDEDSSKRPGPRFWGGHYWE